MADGLVPGILPLVIRQAILLVNPGQDGMVRLQHLQRLVQPKLHDFLERTVCLGLDGGNGVCQVHIAGVYLPGGQKLLLGPVSF